MIKLDPIGILCKLLALVIMSNVLQLTFGDAIALFIALGLFTLTVEYKEGQQPVIHLGRRRGRT